MAGKFLTVLKYNFVGSIMCAQTMSVVAGGELMYTQEGESSKSPPTIRYFFFTTVWVAALTSILLVVANLVKEGELLESMVSYKIYILIGSLIILGSLIIESASRWVYGLTLRRGTIDNAVALRTILRIAGLAVLVSVVVSLWTSNAAAAVSIGGFAGMVAGFAAQTVMGNAIAGMYMAIFHPIRVGDNVTIAGNTGTVSQITLTHTILETADKAIMIPSSQIINSVLIRNKVSKD